MQFTHKVVPDLCCFACKKSQNHPKMTKKVQNLKKKIILEAKKAAPGQARTDDLEIMRLTRCLLRHRGSAEVSWNYRQPNYFNGLSFFNSN